MDTTQHDIAQHINEHNINVNTQYTKQIKGFWRSPENMGIRLLWTIFAALLVGLVYYQIPHTAMGAFNRVGALFMTLSVAMVCGGNVCDAGVSSSMCVDGRVVG